MKKDYEFKTIHDHLKKRLNQKQRTGMSIGSFMLHHLKQYALYPQEMSIKFNAWTLKVRLIEKENKTLWFHKREQYRTELNDTLTRMGYAVQVQIIKIV